MRKCINKRPIAAMYPVPQAFTKEQSAAMHAGYAAQKTDSKRNSCQEGENDHSWQAGLLQTTLICCSTGTEAGDKVLALAASRQNYLATEEPTGAWSAFRNNFAKPELKIKATDNRRASRVSCRWQEVYGAAMPPWPCRRDSRRRSKFSQQEPEKWHHFRISRKGVCL